MWRPTSKLNFQRPSSWHLSCSMPFLLTSWLSSCSVFILLALQTLRDFDAALAYFSLCIVQAVLQACTTIEEHYVHPSICFSNISKILNQIMSRKPPYTSCLIHAQFFAQREGATEVVGFFGSPPSWGGRQTSIRRLAS